MPLPFITPWRVITATILSLPACEALADVVARALS